MPLALEVQSLSPWTTRYHVFLKARPGSGSRCLWWERSYTAPAHCEVVLREEAVGWREDLAEGIVSVRGPEAEVGRERLGSGPYTKRVVM